MTDRKNHAQIASAAYRLPVLDPDFLTGDSTRGARFMLEYQKAEDALRAHRVASTIVVFGSARVRENGPDHHANWYAEARRFGRIASERGGALDGRSGQRLNVIATGGGGGIMEAANRGASEAGAVSIGFNIALPREQEPNAYSTPELTFQFHYFAMRKMHFAMRARALAIFPGGFGTLDELFEVLTLRQTGKLGRLPIVLVDGAYWSRVLDFQAIVAAGFVDAAEVGLVRLVDDAEEAWAELVAGGLDVG